MRPTRGGPNPSFKARVYVAFGMLAFAASALVARAIELQLVQNDFLISQGHQRQLREVTVPAHRGVIFDRNGEPLAVSTPVESVSVRPAQLGTDPDQWSQLAVALNRPENVMHQQLSALQGRTYAYLGRHMNPADTRAVRELDLPGIEVNREFRRYYPSGEVAGHLLGFNNIDDIGQEGIELNYDHWLAGDDGRKRVLQDNKGRHIEDVDSLLPAVPGRDLTLSIDMRIQYLAYRELKAAIRDHQAASGSMVVLDVTTGEVLAMVNQPGFNPNDRSQMQPNAYRNLAAVDMLEPGSSIKPFVMAAALESGKYNENSQVDIHEGYVKVGTKVITDEHPLGIASLSTILSRSSNVGMSKIGLSLEPRQLYGIMRGLGFGQTTGSGFPGESQGKLTKVEDWRPMAIASLSYGYGLSVTPLQLAHAYATVGAGGLSRPISLLRVDHPVQGTRIVSDNTARKLIGLLETVITPAGTGKQAAIAGYRVAGKTGTARRVVNGVYADHHYVGVFGGMAPATNPRLAAVVVITDPRAGQYHGGEVSAPVFSAVMGGALRLMGIAPDDATAKDSATPAQTLVSR
ncbi:MAG: penicillin-binding transpeptidase domain-containing protein [Proteobacteria bacterium]|nr:penicillin-binding transpeptidase domain-containing protein [Pseudomonadota bacterium]